MNKPKIKSVFSILLCLCLLFSGLTACEQQTNETVTATNDYTAGTYVAESQGNNGPIKVEVTFSDNAIEKITVLEHEETKGLSDPVFERVPAKVVEGQTLKVDVITGATKTSNGLLQAIASCVELAGGDVLALQTVDPINNVGNVAQTIEKETDLLIIGAGGAGLTTANAALQNGVKNVIVLEKLASFANATAVAGGLAGGDSDLQRSFGLIDDSSEKIYNDLMKGGGYTNDEKLVRIWSKAMGPTVDWLINDMDVKIENQFSNFPEHSVQRSFYVTGGSGEMLKTLASKFTTAGGELLMETEAENLIVENGNVVGAVAKDIDGNIINIRAKKTVMATGGFGNNPEMLSDALSGVLFYGAVSSTGEGIKMAEAIGAKLKFMDYVKMYPQGIEIEPGRGRVASVHSMNTTQNTGAIYVNKEGKRIINENLDFVAIKNATKEQTDNIIYLVMDQEAWNNWSTKADSDTSAAGRLSYEEQEKWFNTPGGTPIFRRGNDIEQVAAEAGIDGKNLKETIENWNNMVINGEDAEFGRKELYPLATDDVYYIVEQKLRFATTLGGISITEDFQVLNNEGNTIPGLYAVGECVGGVHGNESMPTCMLSWAVTSGKLAGEKIAQELQ